MKINLRFWKKNKFSFRPVFKKVGKWISRWPTWLKFAAPVIFLSLLTSLLSLFLYDRFYGSSPISNKGRLVKEALEVCNQVQTLATAAVDFTDWPLESTYDLEGQGLGATAEFFANAAAYTSEDGPSAADSYAATSWLKEKYAEYFTAQERCNTLAQEYQEKYQY